MRPLPARELEDAASHVPWHELRGAEVLLTGGTGFLGAWLTELLLLADTTHGLGVRLHLLTRDPRRVSPWVAAHRSVRVVVGDVVDFALPEVALTHVIHGATASSPARTGHESPAQLVSTIVDGTRSVVEVAKTRGARRMLYMSSGAVYGRQPPDLAVIPETWPGAPDPLHSGATYGTCKRLAEHLCVQESAFETVVARIFAVAGAGLPTDQHFALGNFVADALRGGPIVVRGDGSPLRSYLHAGDLAAWCWRLLLEGHSSTAYNVGSDEAVSIAQLAQRIAARTGVTVDVQGTPRDAAPERYVPDVSRARALGLDVWTTLDAAIDATLAWYR